MNKIQLLQSLKSQGFSNKIINAFSKVKRENFVPENLKKNSYEDIPLPIGNGATISQPYTIALMLSLLELKKGQKILEIGSGCGYVLALISLIIGNGKVFGVEIIKELADKSGENLREYKNIEIYNKNGSEGLEEFAPFDRILISAACRKIPKKFSNQLKEKGILVIPLGKYEQSLVKFQKVKNKIIIKKKIPGFIFVPFVEDAKNFISG